MRIREDVVLPPRLWVELVQWRAGYRCERCGRDREALKREGLSGHLHGHHKDGDHDNMVLANGECLCPACHGRIKKTNPRPGSRRCEPGCTCGRHKNERPTLDDGTACKHGHVGQWFYDAAGKKRCLTCRRESFRRNKAGDLK